jgi:hypothetical protein
VTTFIPLGDPLRELLLIVEATLILACIQSGIIYTRKFLKTKTNFTILAWGVFLFAFSILFSLYIAGDFYTDIGTVNGLNMRDLIMSISYSAGIIGVFLFSYNMEREMKLSKHLASIIALCLLGFLILNIVVPMVDGLFLAISGWCIFVLLVILYVRKFTAKMSSEKWRLNVYSLIIGVIIIIIGFTGSSDTAIIIFGGIWIRLLADCMVIAGILFISALFIGVPSLAEFDWPQKIRYLNVIHQKGLSIGHYNFVQQDEERSMTMDDLLMAGGLTSISQLVSELIKSEKQLDFVDHGDVKLLFDYGKYLINVLVVDEPLVILRTKLRKFTEQFELIYEDNLAAWNGDVDQFTLMDALIKSRFEEEGEKESS